MELNKKLFVQAYRSIENDQFKFDEGSIVLVCYYYGTILLLITHHTKTNFILQSFLPSAWVLDVPADIDPQHCRLRLITQTDPANNILFNSTFYRFFCPLFTIVLLEII